MPVQDKMSDRKAVVKNADMSGETTPPGPGCRFLRQPLRVARVRGHRVPAICGAGQDTRLCAVWSCMCACLQGASAGVLALPSHSRCVVREAEGWGDWVG
jgi:hypothetical protein